MHNKEQKMKSKAKQSKSFFSESSTPIAYKLDDRRAYYISRNRLTIQLKNTSLKAENMMTKSATSTTNATVTGPTLSSKNPICKQVKYQKFNINSMNTSSVINHNSGASPKGGEGNVNIEHHLWVRAAILL